MYRNREEFDAPDDTFRLMQGYTHCAKVQQSAARWQSSWFVKNYARH